MEVFKYRSPFQEILLERVDGGRHRLWLDDYIQFDTKYERAYHELLADLAAVFAQRTRTALVLGGGDGLATRELLKYPFRLIVNIELDPAVIALAKHPPLSNINEESFGNRRVRVIAGDALRWVGRLPKGAFDVVIADFPAATSGPLRRLYTKGFYGNVKRLIAPGGVFVTQVSEGAEDLKKIRNALDAVFGHTRLVGVRIGAFIEQFAFASDEPVRPRREAIDAPWAAKAAERLKIALAKGETRGRMTVDVPE